MDANYLEYSGGKPRLARMVIRVLSRAPSPVHVHTVNTANATWVSQALILGQHPLKLSGSLWHLDVVRVLSGVERGEPVEEPSESLRVDVAQLIARVKALSSTQHSQGSQHFQSKRGARNLAVTLGTVSELCVL